MKIDKAWPQLFTCPTDEHGLKKDDLGHGLCNPVFSNREKMVNCGCEGCKDCDMKDECDGPVEYVRKQDPNIEGTCSMCRKDSDECTHLSLYVSGSEGAIVCLSCRMILTNLVREVRSMTNASYMAGQTHARRRANLNATRASRGEEPV